jgi:hypothetical protein
MQVTSQNNDPKQPFSKTLEEWLNSSKPKTLEDLNEVFAEKTFAIAFLLLMSLTALPIPTGGITYVFQAITIMLAIEMLIGRKNIWLPKRWQNKQLGNTFKTKTIPTIIKFVRWFEKYSRPRLKYFAENQISLRALSLVIIIFALAATVAPPFTGLDTLPALGIILISLGLILYDSYIIFLGFIVGVTGIAIIISLAAFVSRYFQDFINLF